MNINDKKNLVLPSVTLKDSLKKLEENYYKCLIVVDKNNKLLGTITDGDIRRAILKGAKFNDKINKYYFRKAKFIYESQNLKNLKKISLLNGLDLIPITNKKKQVIKIVTPSKLLKKNQIKFENKLNNVPLVIMAGGRGSRLKPATNILPKPLIPIDGDKSIIEVIIEKFRFFGINNFYVSINYRSKLIKAFFNEFKKKYKVKLVNEKFPLGTVGSLAKLNKKLAKDFFLCNCDILINTNYRELYKFHKEEKFDLTLVAAKKNLKIPYGVCNFSRKGVLKKIEEKPEINYFASVGLYIINPKILKLIPKDKNFNMDDLIGVLKKLKKKIGVFPIESDQWFDIGEWNQYHRTIDHYKSE